MKNEPNQTNPPQKQPNQTKTKPNQIKSNQKQIEPNQTKPNHTKPNQNQTKPKPKPAEIPLLLSHGKGDRDNKSRETSSFCRESGKSAIYFILYAVTPRRRNTRKIWRRTFSHPRNASKHKTKLHVLYIHIRYARARRGPKYNTLKINSCNTTV